MIDAGEIRNGISLLIDNALYQVVESHHIKPGKGGAFVRVKLKNMKTKAVIERTYRVNERVEDAFIETKNLQYTYNSGGTYHFMDTRTFEDFTISEDMIGEDKKFLKEGTDIISVWHNHNIVDINLPIFMDLKIKHTEPGIKGDTAKGSFKPATLETGAVIQIPLFVNRGDTIRIDTRTGEYIERV